MNIIRKIALQVGALVLLALIAHDAYLVMRHFGQMQRVTALTMDSSMVQIDISTLLRDLTDMETGQRGFLLTAEPSYLEPYTDAKDRIATDFAHLRLGLKDRTAQERSLELQLESLANAKQAEIERTLQLRQDGYRRRAFKLVESGEGKEYMDKARAVLSSLSADESKLYTGLIRERNATSSKARLTILIANAWLFVITVGLIVLARYYGHGLEKQAARSKQELTVRDLQLQKLTSTLSDQARFKTSAIEENAGLLLQEYGGFLPKVGHECAQQIKEAAAQMERIRKDLVGSIECSADEQAAYDSVA